MAVVKNNVYSINTENYNKLNKTQRELIDIIVKFCETEGVFPNEKDMTVKNGYVSRTQFYKYFNTKKFTDIYKYIYPLNKRTLRKDISAIQKGINKPVTHICSKCSLPKPFNEQHFGKSKNSKYKLKTFCKDCENKIVVRRNYRKLGIEFQNFEDIPPEQWWEYVFEGKIRYFPDFCMTKENLSKIVRYVLLTRLKLSKEEMCKMGVYSLKKYKLFYIYRKFDNKLEMLNYAFPELSIGVFDLPKSRNSTLEDRINYIGTWINSKNYSVENILNNEYDSDERMKSFMESNYMSYIKMFLEYFDITKTLHPVLNLPIEEKHFRNKTNNYWDNRDNRLSAIREYAYSNGINDNLDSTEKLQKWIYKYFTQKHVSKILNYNEFYNCLYDCLVDAFPSILHDRLLFKWEWHQWNDSNRKFLIQMLRELIQYRLKLKTPEEISLYLNYTNMEKNGYTKFNKHIMRKRFKNYYEWASLSFPEYSDQWNFRDFHKHVTCDGHVCHSSEEVDIYHFVKYNLKVESFTPIGTDVYGKYRFILPDNIKDTSYTPDFLFKIGEEDVFVEYFGWYVEKYENNKMLTNYRNKTKRKIEYYNTLEHKFIYLFPEDLKDNFKGIEKKINKQLLI